MEATVLSPGNDAHRPLRGERILPLREESGVGNIHFGFPLEATKCASKEIPPRVDGAGGAEARQHHCCYNAL